jgi:hypothetical protein
MFFFFYGRENLFSSIMRNLRLFIKYFLYTSASRPHEMYFIQGLENSSAGTGQQRSGGSRSSFSTKRLTPASNKRYFKKIT